MDKSTISMAMFHSYVTNYQRISHPNGSFHTPGCHLVMLWAHWYHNFGTRMKHFPPNRQACWWRLCFLWNHHLVFPQLTTNQHGVLSDLWLLLCLMIHSTLWAVGGLDILSSTMSKRKQENQMLSNAPALCVLSAKMACSKRRFSKTWGLQSQQRQPLWRGEKRRFRGFGKARGTETKWNEHVELCLSLGSILIQCQYTIW